MTGPAALTPTLSREERERGQSRLPTAPLSFLDGRVMLHAGDALEVVRGLADNSLDSCVSDPPYALTSIVRRFGPSAEGRVSTAPIAGATGVYARVAAGFMGKRWDNGDVAFSVEFWREVLAAKSARPPCRARSTPPAGSSRRARSARSTAW